MILLDTHVVLWWQAGGERLSKRAAREIARAETVLVSPISCWEIATLLLKGRVTLDREVHTWIRDLLADEQVAEAPLSAQGAVGAALLAHQAFPGDPADRFLYATARELLVPLLSKDEAIHGYARGAGDVKLIW